MSQQPPLDEMVSVRDAAKRLGRSEEQVRRYLRSGQLTGKRIGGQWFIPASDLRLPPTADDLPRDHPETAPVAQPPAEPQGPTPEAVAARGAALEAIRSIRQGLLQRTGRPAEVEALLTETRTGPA